MRTLRHIPGAACLALAFAARAYTAAPFENYQAILDRMPFGAPPPQSAAGADADAAGTQTAAALQAEQEKLAAKIKMSCVNVTPDGGVAVGFTDLSQNPPRDCYLRVGAAAHGWSVLDADYDAETATIEKDGVAITVKLGRGLIGGVAAAPVAQAAPANPAASATPAVTAESAAPQEPAEPPPMIVQYARLRAIELAGGPPMPNVSLATIPPEKQAELDRERQKIRDLRKRGVNTRFYHESLQAKMIAAEQQRQAEDQEKLADMEEIARAIAQEELERRAQEQAAAAAGAPQ